MADNLSNKIKGLYITGTKIKDLVLNGVSLFNAAGTPPTGRLVIDGHTVTKLMVFGVCAYDSAYAQKWSTDPAPAVSGATTLNKIPVDEGKYSFGLSDTSLDTKFRYDDLSIPEQAGYAYGLSGANLETKFCYKNGAGEDSCGYSFGIVNATLETKEL